MGALTASPPRSTAEAFGTHRKVRVTWTRLSGTGEGWVKATVDHNGEKVSQYGPTINEAIERLRQKIEVMELKGNPRDIEVWW